jgi:hypothetical protein
MIGLAFASVFWEDRGMTVRIEFPFSAVFEANEFISNSRELRTEFLQQYLHNSGMELGGSPEKFEVKSFHGEDTGEFWDVTLGA